MIRSLDELERDFERRLRAEYHQAKAINSSITSFLFSAAKVTENRDRFLNLLGIEEATIKTAIDEADAAVSKLVDGKEKVTDKVTAFKEAIGEVRNTLK